MFTHAAPKALIPPDHHTAFECADKHPDQSPGDQQGPNPRNQEKFDSAQNFPNRSPA